MPKNSRAKAKRVVEQAVNDLERAKANVCLLLDMFQHHEADYVRNLLVLLEALMLVHETLSKFKEEF